MQYGTSLCNYCYLLYNLNSANPAKRYEARENAGEVVFTYNPGGISDVSWKQQQIVKVQNVDCEPLTENFKYMFQKILDKSRGKWLSAYTDDDRVSLNSTVLQISISCKSVAEIHFFLIGGGANRSVVRGGGDTPPEN